MGTNPTQAQEAPGSYMKIIFWISLMALCSCVAQMGDGLIQGEQYEAEQKNLKLWAAERLVDYQGRYSADVYASSVRLLLQYYRDPSQGTFCYAAVVMTAKDFLAKPTVETLYGLKKVNGGLGVDDTKAPLLRPVVLADGGFGMEFRGIILKKGK